MDIEQSAAVNPSAQMQVPFEQFPLKLQSLGHIFPSTSSNISTSFLVLFVAVDVFLMVISPQSLVNIETEARAKS